MIFHKKLFLLIVSGLLFCSCQNNSKKSSSQEKNKTAGFNSILDSVKNDSIVIAQIENLTEFKILTKQFDVINKRDSSHHLSIMLAQKPGSASKYYWVKVGNDGPERFETLLNFYVNRKNLSVSYMDAVSDSILTLEQWRKSGKDYLIK